MNSNFTKENTKFDPANKVVPRKRILIFTTYYYPAYKSGGALRTISNLIDCLGDEFHFFVVTTDRDSGDEAPFKNIVSNSWQKVGKANVLYLSPEKLTLRNIRKIILSTAYDILYCNSFFAPNFTVKLSVLRFFRLIPNNAFLIAPQGEFSAGAIAIKKTKKMSYVTLAKVFGFYNKAIWHASSEFEAEDIFREFRQNVPIIIAPNLSKYEIGVGENENIRPKKSQDKLRMVFLSRISPKKNIDGVLKILQQKNLVGELEWDIYGPVDDEGYWRACEKLIKELPENINVNYLGHIKHDQVVSTLSQYDLFVLFTHGESYGYAILEALQAGCPVLISDQTPWTDIEEGKVGWVVAIDDNIGVAEILQYCINLTEAQHASLIKNITKYMKNYVDESDNRIEQSRNLFNNQFFVLK